MDILGFLWGRRIFSISKTTNNFPIHHCSLDEESDKTWSSVFFVRSFIQFNDVTMDILCWCGCRYTSNLMNFMILLRTCDKTKVKRNILGKIFFTNKNSSWGLQLPRKNIYICSKIPPKCWKLSLQALPGECIFFSWKFSLAELLLFPWSVSATRWLSCCSFHEVFQPLGLICVAITTRTIKNH